MAFKVFLSYRNGPEEQTMVWRMQTLAAAHGIHVFVPSRNGLQGSARAQQKALLPEAKRMIDRSDCVLAMIAGVPGAFVQAELTYALSRGKIVIPILREGIPQPAFLDQMPQVFRFSPTNPGMVEAQVITYLRQQKVEKDNRQAIGGLILLGLGLLMWSTLAEK
jgi:nucleoside 2-deoxyribosyltransferase